MDAETVDDLLVRDRRSDRPALVDATGKGFDYAWLCTTSWKAGNFLSHTGVRRGVTVGVVGDGPFALLAFFGTALLEGTTRFDPPGALADDDRFRTLVAPVDAMEAYELPVGAQRVGYGEEPEEPGIHHLEAGLWSENPSFPPVSIAPDTPLLTDGDRTVSHGRALSAAAGVVDDRELGAGSRVAVATPLGDPRTVVAGVLAPLLAGGVVVLGDGDADLVVAEEGASGGDRGETLPLSAVELG